MSISTHALTWRATFGIFALSEDGQYISTHALTWRATVKVLMSYSTQTHFYPRPHMEGDARRRPHLPSTGGFLPTPSHGGRPKTPPASLSMTNFYPRPHMEGDKSPARYSAAANLFLPTPSHGGRPFIEFCNNDKEQISTHALTWRATG